MGILKENQKPKVKQEKGIVYIIKAQNDIDNTKLFKIGKSNGLRDRINNYNSGNANDIKPLFKLKCDDINSVEDCIKALLRERKEIYEVDIKIIRSAMKKCKKFMKAFSDYAETLDEKNLDELLRPNAKFWIMTKNN